MKKFNDHLDVLSLKFFSMKGGDFKFYPAHMKYMKSPALLLKRGGLLQRDRLFSTSKKKSSALYKEKYPLKLVINSTYDNIVFINSRSILFLPCIYLMSDNIKSYDINSKGEFINELVDPNNKESVFFQQLSIILENLYEGEYSFEFYFYVEQRFSNLPVIDLFSYAGKKEGVYKDYIIKSDKGVNSGYKKLIKITLPLFKSNFIFQLFYIADELSKGLLSLKSIADFKVLDECITKDVLLVITSNKKYDDRDIKLIIKNGFNPSPHKGGDLISNNSSIPLKYNISIKDKSKVLETSGGGSFNSKNTGTTNSTTRSKTPVLVNSILHPSRGKSFQGSFIGSIWSVKKTKSCRLFSIINYNNKPLSDKISNKNKESIVANNQKSDIITKTLSGKERQFHVWMDFKMAYFDIEYFIQQIKEHPYFGYGIRYSVLTKLERFEVYRTVVPAIPVYCKDKNNLSDLYQIHGYFSSIMEEFNNKYKGSSISNPDSLILSFFAVTVEKKYSLSDKMKSLLTEVQYKNTTKEINLFDYKVFDNKNLIENKNWNGFQSLNWDGEYINSFDEELEDFNGKYLKETINRPHINYTLYTKKYHGKTYVVINMKLGEDLFLRKAFNNKGFKVSEVLDTYDKKNQLVKRVSGNFIYNYDNNRILFIEKNIKFKPIKYINKPSNYVLPNQSFGTLDIETFTNIEGNARCYAIGYYINDPKEENYFYINKDLDSFELIHRCFTELMLDKHKKRIFYVHNLGKFDAVFIIKALSVYNQYLDNPYYFDHVDRNGDFIKLVIKRMINNKIRTVTLLDSWAMLPLSLRDLCKAYEVNIIKSFFPYNFVNEKTLWYKGNTPAKSYYPSNLSIKEYKKLVKTNWELMYETLIYLKQDLKSLHEVLRVVNRNIFTMFGIQMTESNTSTSLGLKILYTKYNSPDLIIPSITDKEIYTEINNSYYGGRVEVFKAYGQNLFYYDVNSLYPFASLNSLCGLNANYVEYLQSKIDINELFGFFYCEITTPNDSSISKYIGLLPYRDSDGSLSFPIGSWKGWYFSEELKFAANTLGYKIIILKGYKFEKIESPLKPYITKLNSIKINPRNTAEKKISKLLMNSIIGRFGMKPEKSVSELVNKEKHNLLATTRVLYNSIEITKELFFDTFSPFISKDICTKYEVDYFKVRNSLNSKEKNREYNDFSSIVTASAILGYSRIYMAKAILYVLEKGGNVYYTDTDSIVTDIKLPDHLVSPSEIGKFKLEHEVIEAYFLADKFYSMKTTELDDKGNNKIVTRTKGLSRDSVSWEKMKELYETGEKFTSTKLSSKKNIREGSVVIEESDIVLNLIYKKRKKILDSKGRWIDTVPLIIKETTFGQKKSLVTYRFDRYKNITLSLIPYVNNIRPLNLILYNPNPIKKTSLIPYIIYIHPSKLIVYNPNPIKKTSLIPYIIYIHPSKLIIYNPPITSLIPYKKSIPLLSLIKYNRSTRPLILTPFIIYL